MNSKRTRVCVPVCENDFGALRSACERASECADVIELRLDCLDWLDGEVGSLSKVLSDFSRPVILTFRPSEQGGHRNLTREARLAFWKTQAQGDEMWWDLEFDVANELSPD